MNKFIIRNYTKLDDLKILSLVSAVMSGGKISNTKHGQQYCCLSSFSSYYVYTLSQIEEGGKKANILVHCTLLKSGTSTFYIQYE